MRNQILLILFIFSVGVIHLTAQDLDRKIQFPDVPGFLSLKCDLHIHTVFSDGSVWPNIRVDEAVRDGLDAISLTEHLEYQPHEDDIPNPDRNKSYNIAKELALPHNLLIIPGAEITRKMPPGHANALFIQDANKLIHEDAYDAYKAAHDQGAFVFWNHPNWINQQENALPYLSDFHKKLIKENLLHGIEAANDITYSLEAMNIAIEEGLTIMGTSDIHGLIDWQFKVPEGGHRPINLVFAKERSIESIKEALFAHRTVTWYNNIIAGRAEHVKPLINACLTTQSKGPIGPSSVIELNITNVSDARFILKNMSNYHFYNTSDIIEILPHSAYTLQIITESGEDGELLSFEVLNALIEGGAHPTVSWSLD